MAHNILVVDDSATVRAVIAKVLGLAGIDLGVVYQAANGKEALTAAREHHIDLILTDINMPEMGGMELVAKLQEDPSLAQIPVVVVSTEGSSTRVDTLRELGVRAYLRKPFTPEQVKQTVDEIMGANNATGS